MELIYQDLEQWELKQQYEFINSLAPDFRANLALHCPDIINLARCSNLASKEILAIKDLCGSISSSAVARLGAVCAHHHHEKLPWSPLALAVTATNLNGAIVKFGQKVSKSGRALKRSGSPLKFGWPIIHGGWQDPAPRTPGHSKSLEEREGVEEKPEEAGITKEEKNVGSKGGTSKEKASSKELEEPKVEEPKDKKEDRKVPIGRNSRKKAVSKVSGEESETQPEKKKRSS
ncbi:MAG: hypothetical protein LQ337_005303 [Flavoplaca oasis]|nr:MAG: hypothetical protein LQ337_005303 [Flavoplaca oasis]